jgi:hypothetical protein
MSLVKIIDNCKLSSNVKFIPPFLFWYNYTSTPTLYSVSGTSVFIDEEGLKVNDKNKLTSFISNQPIGGSMVVEDCKNLENLQCNSIGLTSLKLKNLPALKELRFGGNTLNTINLTSAPNLEKIFFGGLLGSVQHIDFTSFQNLKEINASSSLLTGVAFQNLQNLQNLTLNNSQITNWDFNTSLPSLTSISLGGTSTIFTSIDFSGLNSPSLSFMGLGNSYRLSTANFGSLSAITTLNVNACRLSALDISKMTRLINLNTSGLSTLTANNVFTTLSLSSINSLEVVSCSRNSIKNFILGVQPNLRELRLDNNHLSSLDLSGAGSSVTVLNCEVNNLTSVDISNLPLCYSSNLNFRFNNIRGNLTGLNSLSAFNGNKTIRIQSNNMTAEHLNTYYNQLPTKTAELTGTWTIFVRNNPGTTGHTPSIATNKGWVVNTSTS